MVDSSAKSKSCTMTTTEDNENVAMNLFDEEPQGDKHSHATMQTYLQSFTMPSPADKKKPERKKANLGLILGVFLPTIQHIFGVLMFLRLFWIVGSMGILESFLMVFLCCVCTFLTTLSMSAIATNGKVEAGGAYFMISRNLGPEFGTAIGILFYLANTVATSMYLVGAVEILLMYLAPDITIPFGVTAKDRSSDEYKNEIFEMHLETEIDGRMTNNFRVYGTVLLLVVTGIVACGVRFVQFFAPVSLLGVIVSILAIYAGAIERSVNEKTDLDICVVNRSKFGETDSERILIQSDFYDRNLSLCTSEHLLRHFDDICRKQDCIYGSKTSHQNQTLCYKAFLAHCTICRERPFTGFNHKTFKENTYSAYMKSGESAPGVKANETRDVFQDTATNFFALLAIYFPSVTGIMTGSNMSGDLRDPQKSIPTGTILAQLTCTFVYLSLVVVFGGTIDGLLLRDKYGRGIENRMVVANLAYPHEYVVMIGCFTSTFGAALQCLCGAPRLLQSIAEDEVLPFLRPFSKVTKCHQEPILGLLLSSFIAVCFLMIGTLDYVAPIVDFFFLMCYAVVNLVCALNSFLRVPNWRPRYKIYNAWASLLGFVLCFFIMFSTHWYYAVTVLVITAGIYAYVSWKGNKREWGDGVRGLYLTLAQYFLLKLEDKDFHPKNWRPQLLVLIKADMEKSKRAKMMELAEQLKAGRGLTVVTSLLSGDVLKSEGRRKAKDLKHQLQTEMKDAKLRGFAQTILFKEGTISAHLDAMVQCAGIGGLKPNTIMVGWPYSWKEKCWENGEEYWDFLDKIHRGSAFDRCLLIARGLENFPSPPCRLVGNIDIWWFIQDGGILILLGFILTKHPTWSLCKLRIFVVAQELENSLTLKKELTEWLYHLRIEAQVIVEEMTQENINEYSHVRTVMKEEREQMLKEMDLLKNKKLTKDMLPHSITERMNQGNSSYPILSSESFRPSVSVTHTYSEEAEDAESQQADSETPQDLPGKVIASESHRKFRAAADLNKRIKEISKNSEIVIVNLPRPPKKRKGLPNYLEYIDALTVELKRSLLVRGCGKEVITMFS